MLWELKTPVRSFRDVRALEKRLLTILSSARSVKFVSYWLWFLFKRNLFILGEFLQINLSLRSLDIDRTFWWRAKPRSFSFRKNYFNLYFCWSIRLSFCFVLKRCESGGLKSALDGIIISVWNLNIVKFDVQVFAISF